MLDGQRRRRNRNNFPPPPSHDEVYVHTPWLALITERQYASVEQRSACVPSFKFGTPFCLFFLTIFKGSMMKS